MTGGESWDGYTPAVSRDRQPVDKQFAGLWPAGTAGIGAAAPGHQQQPRTTTVEEPPSKSGKRKRKPAAGV